MSGWTSVALVHPICKPPTITAGQLSEFIERFLALGVTSKQHQFHSLRVKYGKSIDQDRKLTERYVPDKVLPLLLHLESQELDIEQQGNPLDFQSLLLAHHSRKIYRAGMWLGCINEGATKNIDERMGEGYLPARLYDWHLSIEPLCIESPVTDQSILIGWMSLSLGGQGYLTKHLGAADLVSVVRELPECQKVEELVRSYWPVSPRRPSREVRRSRIAMGHYWTGVSADEPLDWFWTFVGSY